MKELLTKEKQAKKTKRNQLIVGGVLIFIMLSSTLGYAWIDRGDKPVSQDKIIYNNIEFLKDDSGYWFFNFQALLSCTQDLHLLQNRRDFS